MFTEHPFLAAAASLVIMFSIGALYAWSVFVVPLEVEFGASRSAISSVFSLAVVTFTLCMLLGARLYRYAPPPAFALATLGLAAAGLALAGWGRSIAAVAIGFGCLFGFANGLGYGFSLQLAQEALPRRRGLVTGLAVASYTLGSATFATLFAWAIRVLGLASTFYAAALYMLAIGLLAYVLLRAASVEFPDSAPERAAPAPAVERPGVFLILWLGFLLGTFAGVMVLGHAAAIVGSFGGSPEQMALGASLVAVGNGIGRLTGGWLGDHLPPRRLLSIMMILAGGALLVGLALQVPTGVTIALFTMGIGYGAMAGGYPVVISHLYGIGNLSRIYGQIFTAWGLAGLAGPLVAGILFDRASDYQLALILAAAAALGAGLVCAVIPEGDGA